MLKKPVMIGCGLKTDGNYNPIRMTLKQTQAYGIREAKKKSKRIVWESNVVDCGQYYRINYFYSY